MVNEEKSQDIKEDPLPPPKKYARKTVRLYHSKIKSQIFPHLPKYAQIELHIMPINA